MSSLPEEMQLEIYSRLPVKTVLRFKSLCKTCCNHFGKPCFVKMHRDHAIRKNCTFIMLHYEVGVGKINPMYSVEYNSLSSKLSSGAHNPFSEAVEMDYPIMPSDSFEILGSCDGLLCLLDTSNATSQNDIFLWNPSTKEYRKIPTPPNFEHSSTIDGLYGFGYDDSIDDFKLVRVAEIYDSDTSDDGSGSGFGFWSTVEIYTLGSNSWRLCECQEMPYYFPRGMTPGVVVNGALHWCAEYKAGEYCEAIISFDMTNEIFTEVAKLEGPMVHPVVSDSDSDTYRHTIDDSDFFNTSDVGVLGGCLSVLDETYGVSVDVWVMQEYGVKESWTKRFTITQYSITKTSRLRVVCEFQNNEILFETDEYSLLRSKA